MEIVTGLVIGLVVGAVIAYLLTAQAIKKANSKSIEESNRQADLVIQEARLTAKRLEDEAAVKAEKVVSRAEAENERIKQTKIQEAKERYSQMRSQFDSEKAQHQLSLKEMEVE
ncbi:MAG: ribonuclease Y, partial [Saprospiraceae bacterium]|nr:ribonuclease Y [Saprospiraceae bacterium]